MEQLRSLVALCLCLCMILVSCKPDDDTTDTPPEEIKDACTFVPVSAFAGDKGFFVIFQSAATGECIKPERA